MHDSGKRQGFDTGAVRDTAENKPRPDLISPFAKMRLGDWLRKGAEKYAARNWEKGIPIGRCVEAIERHLCKYEMGMRDEDHMAAVMCNAMFIMHYEEMIKLGVLPATLNDMPDYSAPAPIRKVVASKCLAVAPTLDGYIDKIGDSADVMANARRRVDEAQDALMKELDRVDKGYELELKGQLDRPRMGKVHKQNDVVKAVQMHRVRKFILPDNNKMNVPTCDICGCKDQDSIKYYRLDLERYYCSLCYHNNRIDLKPVINWR